METKVVARENIRQEITALKSDGWRLILLSGVDWVAKNGTLEVVYHFAKLGAPDVLTAKVSVPASDPRVPSVTDLFGLADWHERETYDLFGIIFEGHPNLTRIFLPDDYPGHPLRKDFIAYKRQLPG